MNKLFSSACLLLLLITACSKNDQLITENTKKIYTDKLVLNLEANVVNELEDARIVGTIEFLGRDKDGKIYPKLNVPEGVTSIPVHTAIANKNGTVYGARTIEWIYTPEKDGQPATLQCPTDQEIELSSESQFTPGNETFYVTAVIEGNLLNPKTATQKVDFSGNTDLKGITSAQEKIANLKAPFAMPWTKLTIFKDKARQKNVGTSRFSSPQGGDNYRPIFKPQGSFIGFRLDNKTSGTLTPTEIFLRTQQFGISGTFDLHKPAFGVDGRGTFPTWTFDPCAYAMRFSFNNATTAANVPGHTLSNEVYYTWVMATPASMTVTEPTSAILEARSSDLINSPLNDYWQTSFTGAKKPIHHTAHQLKLSILQNAGVRMPVEDFTDYNIAGGEEYPNLQYLYDETQPKALKGWVGRRGPYRLTASRRTIHSGMYNHYMVVGQTDARLNPNGHDLENLEIKAIEEVTSGGGVTRTQVTPFRLGDQYYIPTDKDYAGLIPSDKYLLKGGGSPGTQKDLGVRFGGGSSHPIRIDSDSEYTGLSSITDPQDKKSNLRFYGLRFKNATIKIDNASCKGPKQFEIKLISAFRYTYKYRKDESGLLEVDVVYLGTEATGVTSSDLANQPEAFWTSTNQRNDSHKGVFIKSIAFPAVGDLTASKFQSGGNPFTTYADDTSKPYDFTVGHYYSRTPANTNKFVVDWANGWDMTQKENGRWKPMPVRVFKKNE